MIAVIGGLGAAVCWATASLCASRASRMIGPMSNLAWVMVVGLPIALVGVALNSGVSLSTGQGVWLVVTGFGNCGGLLLTYTALRSGAVGVVIPIVSTEGAIAALIAVATGEKVSAALGVTLVLIAIGVVCVAWPSRDPERGAARPGRSGHALRIAALASAAALTFGVSLYGAGRISSLPLPWLVLPSRVVGSFLVALPLAFGGTLRLTRPSVKFVALGGLCEVLGFFSYGLGARHGIAIAAVVASFFAALAALGAYVLFHERLGPLARIGLVAIAVGVSALSAISA